jgi:ATP-dependent helicase HepA
VRESGLSGMMSRRGPLDRLGSGKLDGCGDFELRREALFRRARVRRSAVRGFAGARMELIPHQLGIAAEVSGRLRPRVLLADEVGLGKTIEACLILHRLHLTGRADRVLILVPEPLVHQWFVELLRRFNLRFSIFDAERCESIEAGPEGENANPFLDSQLVLCPLGLLAEDSRRGRQAVAAGWDLLIVDEAHRLSGSGGDGEGGYVLVERLAEVVPGVLLLSGTPQQAGQEGHFARLRLLDPARYGSFNEFCQETRGYGLLADQVAELEAGNDPDKTRKMADLLDRCGIGRVMFRNVRAALGGFPARLLRAAPLEDAAEGTRVKWLAGLLRSLGEEKVLLICRERERAEALREALLLEIEVKAGVFHEGLTLLQRDRQAAWFSEEDGARILLCSEIGSEGRNFQFARHLVLWDLPEDPELLEQRIGRLDRIGQRGTIHLHVPYVPGSPEEVMLRWYAEGLGSFAGPVSGVSRMAAETGLARRRVIALPCQEDMDELVRQTVKVREQVTAELSHGYDRLLQWQTRGQGGAAEMVAGISAADADQALEDFWVKLLEALGMQLEELRPHRWMLQAGSPETEALPELPVEGLSGTFDRRDALEREDIAFFSMDHPLLRGALDLLLGGDHGSASCAILAGMPEPGLTLEICYVVECVAPAALHADRFLPALPVRIVVDHQRRDRSGDERLMKAKATDADAATARTACAAVRQLDLAATAEPLGNAQRDKVVAASLKKMHRTLGAELERMRALAELHGHVSAGDIAALEAQRAALETALSTARLRVDAVRVGVAR